MENQKEEFELHTTISEKTLWANLEVSYLMQKNLKMHRTGESPMLPSAIKMTSDAW